jgi:arylsulfatase A-like enzyme
MIAGKTDTGRGSNGGIGARVVGAVKAVAAVGLIFAALDTILARVLRLRPEFTIYPVHLYFARSYVLYAVFVAVVAVIAALLALVLKRVWPRRYPGAAAAAAGGALFAPVLALAAALNRSSALTITHPAMLAMDVAVFLLWLFLAVFVGGRWYRRFGPEVARGFGRVVWGVLGYGSAALLIVIGVYFYVVPEITRPPAPGRRMNVLLISIDALRRDHLGCYGYERLETPNIDRFAASATKFENACCNAPWTLPSMASMITGRYPSICGVDALNRLRPGLATSAEILRAEGYRTEAYVTNVFMHPESGYGNGFDVYLMNGDRRSLYPLRGTLLYKWVDTALRATDAALARERTDTQFNGDETVAALQRLGAAERPFFIWCHFMDPHNPYTPPRGYVPDYPGIPAGEAYELLDELQAKGWDIGDWPIAGNDIEKFAMLYDGEIAYVDEHFGRIIDALDETGLADNTVVIVLNDHGEEFDDHGSYGHGHTLYPELINMVLLARVPGSDFPASARTRYISHVDITPTILDAVGLSAAAKFDGRSFLEEEPEGEGGGRAFSERLQRGPEKKAVRRGEWLLILQPAGGKRELYDLAGDPGATENLAGRGVPAEEDLHRELEYFMADTSEAVEELGGPAPMALSDDRRGRLRGLGYVGP